MAATFKLLGTGAGPGVPSFYCNCIACQEARENPHFSRTRSGAILDLGEKKILIDASPDLRHQLLREKIGELSCIFVTHWHYDHFGGLGEVEFYVRLVRHEPLTLYLPPSAVEEYRAAFPHLQDVLVPEPWQFGRSYDFGRATLTPLPANHSIETAGILVVGKKSLAYFTDTCGLPAETLQRVQGVDILICDATFHGENWYPHSHMSVEQAIALGRATEAGKTILTHLAMHYSQAVTVRQLEQEIASYPGVSLAFDGLELEL
ncbi:MBL fold metallo-hydrolase [Neomoorella humiferrea]|uniref:MBL fold metallo-hydrolase n=1 Tax=Neomoorella humiferrea TaxID=676965 RepID=UPI003D9036B2